jgi:hypothetical protein
MSGLSGSSGNLNIGTVAIVADHAYTPSSSVVPQGYSLSPIPGTNRISAPEKFRFRQLLLF